MRGHVVEGSYRIKGDLARFPFINPADGDFRITGRVTGATLDVHPAKIDANSKLPPPGSEWPLLTDIDADLVFERASMAINAQRGRAFGVFFTWSHVGLAAMPALAGAIVERVGTPDAAMLFAAAAAAGMYGCYRLFRARAGRA